MEAFFDSNFFQTTIILLVGFFAFVTYRMTKRDERKNAALLVIMELRSIEENLNKLKDSRDYYVTSPVVTSNEWNTYKHLLVGNLDNDQYKTIDDLYNVATRIEQERRLIREQIEIIIKEKARAYQEQIISVAAQMWDQEKSLFDERARKIADLCFPSAPEFKGKFPKELMEKLLHEYTPVMSTTAGEKLKKIAN
ncbi:hypothetical protein QP794_24800 [Paenibacillus sp. UMB7766-LJ446]|uniref:hypothetical protein n=1 Tax=Paenibacillus sp. UMB7766-LJ446 TaxID=3046313 RepID=UPI0025503E45|nr:hypothetical protein [Paenibacillus sp. UMB7766-LJ446]MDK8193312.1 hypothetical protein [Paenibacillus sp. UMB7766-LJ446]